MGSLPGGAFFAKYRLDSGALVYLVRATGVNLAAIQIDNSGALYATGSAAESSRIASVPLRSLDDTTTGGFIAKVTPSGDLAYASLFRVTAASDIAVTDAGEAVVTGEVLPGELPPTAGVAVALNDGGRRGFVAKFSASGDRIVWTNRGIGGRLVALDASGNVYAAGAYGGLGEPPVTPGAFQSTHNIHPCGGTGFVGFSCDYAHIAKLDPTGTTLLFGTFLAGDFGATPSALAIDAEGNVIVAGSTRSDNFPSTEHVVQTEYHATTPPYVPLSFRGSIQPPAQTGFVAKLNSTGSGLLFSTYLGGSKTDQILDLRLRPDWIYLSGELGSEDMPGARVIKNECLPRGFAVRMSLDGTEIGDVQVLNGPGNSIAVDSGGLVHTLAFESLGMDREAQIRICVTDAATVKPIDRVAPGQLISIFGPNLGRTETAPQGERLPTSLGNLSVEIDGVQSPLLYSSDRQANAIVPYSVDGKESVAVKLSAFLTQFIPTVYQFSLSVTERSPSVFQQFKPMQYCTFTSALFVKPTALIHNADGTVNDCSHPAQGGSVVTVFLNGGGSANPATTAGLIASNRSPVGVTISGQAGGQDIQVTNVSLDPGSATGVWRLEFRLPSILAAGPIEVAPLVEGKPIAQGSFFLFAAP